MAVSDHIVEVIDTTEKLLEELLTHRFIKFSCFTDIIKEFSTSEILLYDVRLIK